MGTGTHTGTKSVNYVTKYFKKLHPPDPGFYPPVTLLIHSGYHAISVSYNNQLQYWQLIDANQLPIKIPKTDKEIAEEVIKSLSKNDIAVFSTEIFCHKNEADKVKTWLSGVKHETNKNEVRTD